MKENLKTTRYANNTAIAATKMFNPNNSEGNVAIYGKLYTWSAATRDSSTTYPAEGQVKVQGICPDGWHVPSDAEWDTLIDYVKSKSEYQCNRTVDYIAKALASKTRWNNCEEGTCAVGNNQSNNNATGFSAVPAGFRFDGSISDFGSNAYFCCATTSGSYTVWFRRLRSIGSAVYRDNLVKETSFSVRCLKDKEVPAAMSVTTDSANTVTNNSAKLHGNVTNMGGKDNVNVGFKYGTSESTLTSIVVKDVAMAATGLFSCDIDGLTANTQYYFKAFAANGTDTVYGEVKDFKTPAAVFNCGTDSVKDIDENWYHTVQIGNQCWMKENLRTSTNTASTGNIYTPSTEGYNVATFGRLYDWAAVMQDESGGKVQGICPTGWHVPSDAEWTQLTAYVRLQPEYVCDSCSGTDDESYTYCIAKALSQPTGWSNTDTGCNAGNTGDKANLTGFSAVPAGYCFYSSFSAFGSTAYFWCATQNDGNHAWSRRLSSGDSRVSRSLDTKAFGYSVRCLKDAEAPAAMSVTTDSANTVTSNSAKLYGNVTNMGGKDNVYAGFKYGTSESALTSIVVKDAAMTVTDLFSCDIDGLTANTQYYFKAFAANGTDTVYGEVKNFTTTSAVFTCGTDSVKDVDNNWYHTVQIGNQCWMKENLKTTHYANGTAISNGGTNASTTTAYCYYPNGQDSTINTYGYLYNWKAVMDTSSSSKANPSGVQGVCPTGWHVPSDAEWDTLTYYVYNSANPNYKCSDCTPSGWEQSTKCIANALSSPMGWNNSSTSGCNAGNDNEKRNLTGFSAVAAGNCFDGSRGFGDNAYFWSATQYVGNYAWYRGLISNYSYVYSNNANKGNGFSVRCLKD